MQRTFPISLLPSGQKRVIQFFAILMCFLTPFNAQLALAQSNACLAPPPANNPSGTPPPLSIQPNLSTQITLGGQTLNLGTLNSNLAISSQNITLASSSTLNGIQVSSTYPSGNCPNASSPIIQNTCAAINLTNDVIQFQQDTALQFLSFFQIAASDGNNALGIISQRANLTLVSAYLAYVDTELEALLVADPSTLSQHQQNVVLWFNSLIWSNEQSLYSTAASEINRYNANQCGYQPDQALVSAYNVVYSVPAYCTNPLVTLFYIPYVPPPAYFIQYGEERSYGAAASSDPNVAALTTSVINEKPFFERAALELGNGLNTNWTSTDQLAVSFGSGVTAGVGIGIGAKFFGTSINKQLRPYFDRPLSDYQATIRGGKTADASRLTRGLADTGSSVEDAGTVAEDAATAGVDAAPEIAETLGTSVADTVSAIGSDILASAGPEAIATIFVTIGEQSIQQVVQDSNTESQLNAIIQQSTSLTQSSVSAASFLGTSDGDYKIASTLVAACLPLIKMQQIPLPAPDGLESNLSFKITSPTGAVSQSTSFSFLDWDAVPARAGLTGAWFTQSDQLSNAVNQFATPYIHYIDWTGRQWWAARFGSEFLVVKNGYENQSQGDAFQDVGGCGQGTAVPQGDANLYAPQQSGTTSNAYCSSFVTHTLHVTDANGNHNIVEVGGLPIITQASALLNFQPGKTVAQSLQVVGDPTPSFQLEGSLPHGFVLNNLGGGHFVILDTNLNANGSVNGVVPIQAVNSFGTVPAVLQILENAGTDVVSIHGPGTLGMQGGQSFSAAFHIVGPITSYKLSANYQTTFSGGNVNGLSGSITGLKLVDAGNGSFSLTGVPALQTVGITKPPSSTTPVTATLTLSASGSRTDPLNPNDNSFSTTLTVPFSYLPAPDPSYPSTPLTFYSGQVNAAYVHSAQPTVMAPILSDLTISGDPRCSALQVTPQNDGSILVALNNPNALMTPCYVGFNPRFSGDDVPNQAENGVFKSGFVVNIVTQPALTNISNPEFTVGQTVLFPLIPANTSYISMNGVLPNGLIFNSNGPGLAYISGTPAAGTGGEYKVPFVVSNNIGTATQILDIKVFEPPSITSLPYANVAEGQGLTYSVVASGYPSNSPQSCNAMQFNVSNPLQLFQLTSSNENVAENSTNTLELTLPTVAPPIQSPLVITATNSVGSNTQDLLVSYHQPGDVTGDGVANCSDVGLIQALMGAHYGDYGFVSFADINNDGVINAKDLLLVTRYLPAGTHCPSTAH